MTFIPDCLWTSLFIEGLNTFYVEGLNTFYVANIKSVITYGCPAWNNLLSDTDKTRLVRIQRSAARIMLPFSDDNEKRLDNLALADYLDFPTHLMQLTFHQNRKWWQSFPEFSDQNKY